MGRRACTVSMVTGMTVGLMFVGPAPAADFGRPAPAPASLPTAELLSPVPMALEPTWSATVFMGASGGGHDLHVLALRPWLSEPGDYLWGGGAVSRRVARFWTHFALDAEVGVGHRFGRHYRANEGWVAGYVRYDGFFWNDTVYTTFALSTGLNVIDSLPGEETRKVDRHRSAVLHYFSPELTFALPDHRQHELVLRYHHRSGVFGTFNGVRGGSNVVAVGYRYRW